MESLQKLTDDVWIQDIPLRFLGIEVGTRMTVLRLEDGSLFVHSPVRLDSGTQSALDDLGKIKYAVAPNRFHHLFVQNLKDEYPDVMVFAAPGLSEKRKDIEFHDVLSNTAPPEWEGQIDQVAVKGLPMLNEIVFFHKASRTLILTDLVLNFDKDAPFITRCMCWLNGVHNRFGTGRDIRYFAVRDRNAFSESIKRIATWDFDRIVMAHGGVVQKGGKELFLAGVPV